MARSHDKIKYRYDSWYNVMVSLTTGSDISELCHLQGDYNMGGAKGWKDDKQFVYVLPVFRNFLSGVLPGLPWTVYKQLISCSGQPRQNKTKQIQQATTNHCRPFISLHVLSTWFLDEMQMWDRTREIDLALLSFLSNKKNELNTALRWQFS